MSATRAPERARRPAAARVGRPGVADPETLTRRLLSRRVLLCLDYDGTLVPIAARPHLATFDDAGRRLLRALARHMPIAIVSGRSRSAVRRLVGVASLIYVGNHGLEISGPRIRHRPELPATWRRDLNQFLRLIEADAPLGGMVERKGLTASIHYRLVSVGDRRRWLPRLRSRLAAEAANGRCRVVHGKTVLELRPPVDWNKGEAVRWLLSRPVLAGRTPVYLGDDATDEDAFRAIQVNGVGVLVGRPRRSAAHYRLTGPADVRALLVRWLRLLENGNAISDAL